MPPPSVVICFLFLFHNAISGYVLHNVIISIYFLQISARLIFLLDFS